MHDSFTEIHFHLIYICVQNLTLTSNPAGSSFIFVLKCKPQMSSVANYVWCRNCWILLTLTHCSIRYLQFQSRIFRFTILIKCLFLRDYLSGSTYRSLVGTFLPCIRLVVSSHSKINKNQSSSFLASIVIYLGFNVLRIRYISNLESQIKNYKKVKITLLFPFEK